MLSTLFRGAVSAPVAGFCKAETRTIGKRPQSILISGNFKDQTADVEGLTISKTYLQSKQLYGDVRNIVAGSKDLAPHLHPRVIVTPTEWRRILLQYTNENLEKKGTWANYFFGLTVHRGPLSSIISQLAELYSSGATSAYDGRPHQQGSPEYEDYRKRLKSLADRVRTLDTIGSTSFFLCAFWAHVDQLLEKKVLPSGSLERCIHATVAWSKILLSHRAYNCNPKCPKSQKDRARTFIWNSKKPWDAHDDYASAASSIALAYDVLYDRMTVQEREIVRSALALLSLKRHSWASENIISNESMKLATDPNRLSAKLSFYRSNLYITNLAIQGEEEFDAYTTATLLASRPKRCSEGNDGKYPFSEDANMTSSMHLDDEMFEDGYTYFVNMRKEALGLVASHRRGSRLLDTSLFRNFIYDVAQGTEPWQCGNLVGHFGEEEGDIFHSIYISLFKYMYPEGELPAMLWRQRLGAFENCSLHGIDWWQSLVPLAFFAGEHTTVAESPEGLSEMSKEQFKLSSYAAQHGPLITRGSHNEQTAYICFYAGLDTLLGRRSGENRGDFSFSTLRQTWFDHISWKKNPGARKHSLMYVDGLPGDESLTFAKTIRATDNGKIVIAVADLTSSYTDHRASEPKHEKASKSRLDSFARTGVPFQTSFRSDNKNHAHLWGLHPSKDYNGITDGSTDWSISRKTEDDDVGNILTAMEENRANSLLHMVRSFGLIRSVNDGPGLTFFVDSVDAGSGAHLFESYMILKASVRVDHGSSFCRGNYCKIRLNGKGGAIVEAHSISTSSSLAFRVEELEGEPNRLILKSEGLTSEELWTALYPHQERFNDAFSIRSGDDYVTIEYEGLTYAFEIDDEDNGIAIADSPPMEPLALRPWVAHGKLLLHTTISQA